MRKALFWAPAGRRCCGASAAPIRQVPGGSGLRAGAVLRRGGAEGVSQTFASSPAQASAFPSLSSSSRSCTERSAACGAEAPEPWGGVGRNLH